MNLEERREVMCRQHCINYRRLEDGVGISVVFSSMEEALKYKEEIKDEENILVLSGTYDPGFVNVIDRRMEQK